ncbi:MAG: UDP-glucose 4-epimerase GalE [Bacilli bacterium]|nr:UDP-glucose 4-epimerase GalE [Bacilli bacterium]
MKILVTGGTGYIGSHTCVELLKSDFDVVIIDNLSNSKIEVVDKIKIITGKDLVFYQGDIRDELLLEEIFQKEGIDAVIHFAGLKAVGESVKKPMMYYRNNIDGTLTLCEVMEKYDCKKLIFSSSATVYGKPKTLPIKEDFPLSTTNPYGSTKLYIEGILKDLYVSDPEWSIVVLRYFNPIGADKSGLIGENPNDIPNNLMPYIMKVAVGELPFLNVYGNDYDTHDGTGVRDYIHVVDLALGHLSALEILNPGIEYINLGTGNGYSVLDIANTFIKVNQVDIPYKIGERRPGDIDACYADSSYAKKRLNWEAKHTLDEMCLDAYNFIKNEKNL